MMNHTWLTTILALVVSSFTVVAGAQDSEEHERLAREMAAYALNNGMFEVIQNQAIEAAFQSARGFLEVGETTLSESDSQAARTALASDVYSGIVLLEDDLCTRLSTTRTSPPAASGRGRASSGRSRSS